MNLQNLYNKALDRLLPKDELFGKFMGLLDRKIEEARQALFERFEWQCAQSAKSARFMYENNTMYGYIPEEGVESALKHGTVVIGQIGLAETLNILLGKDQTSEEGMAAAIEIEKLFSRRCREFKQKYKMNVGVYLTPAENLCHTAMCRFKAKYGELDGISVNKYFTNSIHVPVWDKVDPFEKADIESKLANYSNAGCIFYAEFDASIQDNTEALEKFILYAIEKCDMPYIACNVPSDFCNGCGYQGLIDGDCPKCGCSDIQRLRRITGYLTGDYNTAFNTGKRQETEMRVKHNGIEA